MSRFALGFIGGRAVVPKAAVYLGVTAFSAANSVNSHSVTVPLKSFKQHIVVGLNARLSSTVYASSVKWNGISGSLIVRATGAFTPLAYEELWIIEVPAGVSGTFDCVVTYPSAPATLGIAEWLMQGLTALSIASASDPTNDPTRSFSLATAAGDFVIGLAGVYAGAARSFTWNLGAENFDQNTGTGTYWSGVLYTATGATTLIATCNSTSASHIGVVAAFR